MIFHNINNRKKLDIFLSHIKYGLRCVWKASSICVCSLVSQIGYHIYSFLIQNFDAEPHFALLKELFTQVSTIFMYGIFTYLYHGKKVNDIVV